MKMAALGMMMCFVSMQNSFAASEAASEASSDKQSENVSVEPLPIKPSTGLRRHMRALQLVQDRMADGNVHAADTQAVLISKMLRDMEKGDAFGTMSEQDTVSYLSMALLNGADPQRIRSVLGENGITSKDVFLLGTLAYAEGRVAESLAAFEQVDPQKLPRLAFAQFHLTKGVMLASIEPLKAKKAFAQARLSASGTLIEESALRREAMLEIENPKRFLMLLKSYLHRFKNSPFASAFISQVAFAISDLAPTIQTEIMVELDSVLASARQPDRQNFFSILARSSLIGGDLALTEFATSRAVSEVTNPSMLLSARLYHAAFNIAGSDYENAAIELESLMRAPLQAADQDILKAAIGVAKELRRWPFDDEFAETSNEVKTEFFGPSQPSNANQSSVKMDAAERLLADTKAFTARPKT